MKPKMRRLPVLISTVAAIPEVSGIARPSTPIVAASGSSMTGNTRFWVRWAPANAELRVRADQRQLLGRRGGADRGSHRIEQLQS